MASCTIEEINEDSPVQPDEFDREFGTVLMRHHSDVGGFLASAFTFLQRRTNFFKEGDAEKRVLEALHKVCGSSSSGSIKTGFLGSKESKPAAEAPAPAAPTPAPAEPAPALAPAAPAAEPAASTSAAAPEPSSTPAPAAAEPSQQSKDAEEEDAEEPKSKGIKPNSGRGADYSHYSWTQTLHEVSVSVPVPAGTRAKMLDVVIGKNKLKVGLKGQPPILEGELSEGIKTEDSMWNIEGGVVELTLQKSSGMSWWGCVIKGDPEIDVHKVEPENSKLTDLDAETRQTVEKMMFDQRQKALGLPTSEEMHKQEMLKKFMAAHPEMDFSGAKMM